jgi:hypothetical protein
MSKEEIDSGRELIRNLAVIIEKLSDAEVEELLIPKGVEDLGMGNILDILLAIFDRRKTTNYPNRGEFLLANRIRGSVVANIRMLIQLNCVFEGEVDGRKVFVAPLHEQWFEDGVMFTEGSEAFAGYLCLYKDHEQKAAITAKEIRSGEMIGPEGFEFVSIDEFNNVLSQQSLDALDKSLVELRELLAGKEQAEVKYQEYLEKYPWVFGGRYKEIHRHTNLDEANIPDFTGVRVHDEFRDIFEIKQPFLPLFRKNGDLTSDFNSAWNQAERYLDFTKENKDYLRRSKGLNFENPKCYLVAGYNLSQEDRARLRIKERSNPAIELFTFNDLLVFTESTVNLAKTLKSKVE